MSVSYIWLTSAQGDDVLPYIEWATSKGFGVIDVNMPKHISSPDDEQPFIPKSLEQEIQQKSKDLLCYLWDNYLQLNDSASLTLMGVGDAGLGIKQLLTARGTSFYFFLYVLY